MAQDRKKLWMSPFTFMILLSLLGCKESQKEAADSKELPDLNAQIRPYITIDNTKLRTGPDHSFEPSQKSGAMPRSKSLDGMAIGCSLFRRKATHLATSKWHRSNPVVALRNKNHPRRL